MSAKRLEEVFKISGVPTYTFVQPRQYNTLKVALRSPGRGVVIEGPSGIGKSTAVTRALDDLDMGENVLKLSARVPGDLELIHALPELGDFGVVVIDDFHRLPTDLRQRLADLLKTLADTEDPSSKLIVVGINQANYSLIQFAPDLANRIDTIKFEVEPPSKIGQLIELGEQALNVIIDAKEQVVLGSDGSFYLAQLLCSQLCIQDGVLEEQAEHRKVSTLYSAVKRDVMERQETRFGNAVRDFARGTKFRPGGRAPYLHILRWLADSSAWSISLKDEMASHRSERISVGQVVDKGYLKNLTKLKDISDILHFDPDTKILSVEDPHLVFYLKNLDWAAFVEKVGFTRVDFAEAYDVALSFAGEDRAFAEKIRDHLEELGHTVFYDLAEQHVILAKNVEAYLGPIYSSGSRYVLAILGEKYGVKRWTLFEADQYRHRIEQGQVIPVSGPAACSLERADPQPALYRSCRHAGPATPAAARWRAHAGGAGAVRPGWGG